MERDRFSGQKGDRQPEGGVVGHTQRISHFPEEKSAEAFCPRHAVVVWRRW